MQPQLHYIEKRTKIAADTPFGVLKMAEGVWNELVGEYGRLFDDVASRLTQQR